MKALIFLTLPFIFCACATQTYRLQSNPAEAEVSVQQGNGIKRVIGKTPLSLSSKEINPTAESLQIEFTKKGFEKQSVFVPASSFDKSVNIDLTLTASDKSAEAGKGNETINKIAGAVAEVQKYIQTKEFTAAEQRLNSLIADYPGVATFYSLQGNVFYLEKKLTPALDAYKKAQELDPNSNELPRIIEKLQSLKSGGSK